MKIIRITLISLLVFYLVYYFHNNELINNDRAKKTIERNGFDYIIDVRSEQEYNDGHYPGSRNIPHDKINEHTLGIMDVNSKILVYCRSGRRAKIAVSKMKQYGYKNVVYINGNYKSIL